MPTLVIRPLGQKPQPPGNDEYPTMKCRPRLRVCTASVCKTLRLRHSNEACAPSIDSDGRYQSRMSALPATPSPPIAAAEEDHDDDDASCRQDNVYRPPQQNQIGVVLVDCCENEDQLRRARRRVMPIRLRICMKMDEDLREEIERDNGPYQTCPLPTRAHNRDCTETA